MTINARKIFLFVGILTGLISACLGLETQPTNHMGWTLVVAGTAFSSIGAVTLGVLFLNETSKRPLGDRSLWLPAFGVLVISLVTPLEYLLMAPLLVRSDHFQDIGLILFVGGLCFYMLMIISRNTRVTLGKQEILQSPRLCIEIIKWILNPTFASLLLIAFGLSIGYSSLIGLFIVFIIVLPGLVYRMKLEGRKL